MMVMVVVMMMMMMMMMVVMMTTTTMAIDLEVKYMRRMKMKINKRIACLRSLFFA